MKINQQLSLETRLPFLTVQDFHMVWEINHHAKLVITGIAQSGSTGQPGVLDSKQRALKLSLLETGDTLFYGEIVNWDMIHDCGIIYIKVEAESASAQLDRKPMERIFQKPSQTYSEIVRDMVNDEGGKAICTVGNTGIQRPFVCYKETVWQFAQRLASQNSSFLIADVVTNRPNIWFGIRNGKKIEDQSSPIGMRIKRDFLDENGVIKKYYCLNSRNSYSIGDWMPITGRRCIIYRKEARFERSELTFLYFLAAEKDLETKPYYNEFITGLSLTGVVRETKKETFRLQFHMDGKSEGYDFLWRPETGNALYAMPEVGANASVYFPDQDEKNGLGIRCWEHDPEDREAENKYFKMPEGAEIELKSESLNIRKNGEEAMMGDASIAIKGSQMQIQAKGKIKMEAKSITLSAGGEIRATTE